MRILTTIDAGIAYRLCGHSVIVSLGSNSSNAYFQLTADQAPQLNTRGDAFNAKLYGIVTNWATFGEHNRSLSEYNAEFDFVLDADSSNKGRKLYVNCFLL